MDPLPLVRYLHGKELEVTNIRLVLSCLDNGFPLADIKERMRPIYGQNGPIRSPLWAIGTPSFLFA